MQTTVLEPLRIAIAGGGIGGLAVALALQRSGAQDVQLYESAAAFEPVGAGLQLGPNAVRILQNWGLGSALGQVACFPESLQVRSALSGKQLALLPLGEEVVLRHGAAHATIHRADLHALLLQALAAGCGGSSGGGGGGGGVGGVGGGGGGVVQIHLGAALYSLAQDTDGVQMGFASSSAAAAAAVRTGMQDGTGALRGNGLVKGTSNGNFHVHADVLIGADGLWSTVRKQLLPGGLPRSTGHQAFRVLLPQSALPVGLRSAQAIITAWLGPGLHVVSYPVRCGDWLNMVVIVQNRLLRSQLGSIVSLEEENLAANAMPAADVVSAAMAISQCCTVLRDLVAAMGACSSSGWLRWPLFDRPAMRSAHEHAKGRIALLGDAAHPMRPYLAQGAAMAIEDADALANALSRVASSPSSASARIPARLQHYAQERWQRNAQVQAKAQRNGQIFHATGPLQWGRDAALRLLGARLLDMPWLYGYGRQTHQRFPGER